MNTLTTYRPFTLGHALSDIEGIMDTFFGDPSSCVGRRLSGTPLVDIAETNDAYLIEAELPGIDEKNVEVNIDGGILSIESRFSVESKQNENVEKSVAEKNYVLRERRLESFCRTFRLPENADPDTIKASFKNGLLSLEIKKRAEAQKRIIPIDK
ncbi:MAG: hypothetical protein Ta2B_21780 [Termitinemataceae bacterium]|nr:MAG: hypothetical protein Ta2B_21780 [Termitinemataceae bacterium]